MGNEKWETRKWANETAPHIWRVSVKEDSEVYMLCKVAKVMIKVSFYRISINNNMLPSVCYTVIYMI